MTLLLLLACDAVGPKFTLVSQQADESCSRLVDYCVRVTCVVKNEGNLEGELAVDLAVQDDGGKAIFSQTERVTLAPGDTKTLSHDFKEARLTGSQAKGVCTLR